MKKVFALVILFLAGSLSGSTFVGRQIATGTDDGLFYWNSRLFNIVATNSRIGYSTSTNKGAGTFFRFTNLTIPQGNVIDSAYLKVACLSSSTLDYVFSRIEAESTDNAATFSDTANLLARVRSTTCVRYDSIPHWSDDGWYRSKNINTVVQTIVSRSGWTSGNAVVLFWEDWQMLTTATSGTSRLPKTYEYSAGGTTSCSLLVWYSVPSVVTRHYPLQGVTSRRNK